MQSNVETSFKYLCYILFLKELNGMYEKLLKVITQNTQLQTFKINFQKLSNT